MAAATHFSKGSFALALALLLVVIASAENYNPATSTTTSSVVKPDHDREPANYNSYFSTTESKKQLNSRMHQYEQREVEHLPKSGKGYRSKSELVHPHDQPRITSDDIKALAPEAERPEVRFGKKSTYRAYGSKPEDVFANGVEGVVACKSGSDYYPLHGAVVRITCSGEEEESRCSTDARGYFFKKLPYYGKLKPELCRAFLEKSPSEKCSVPTDVNKGINGAKLSSYRILHDKRVKLYPLGPFFYSSKYGQQHQLSARQQQVSKSPAGY
ncbi:unnamed protein product [Linum tenue]|uniref:Uncharacterized protein n=1 Tax=Linum tenue TaxID=586396 RepID=A0AAV0MCM7_9ROSI|nr:unnamed protein product [Linum tenue]